MSQLLEVLQKSTLFTQCPPATLVKLSEKSHLKEINPGQAIFFENQESQSFYLIQSGTVTIKKTSEKGDVDIAKIAAGSYLGELALLREANESYPKRSASAEAQEFCVLLEIPYSAFESIVNDDPVFGRQFFKNLSMQLAGRIRRTAQDLSSLKALRLRHL